MTTIVKEIQKNQGNPCKNCITNFATCIEDCSYCAHFVEACDYNKTTPQMVIPWNID